MKDRRRGLFLLSMKEKEYFNEEQNKIELVSCLHGGFDCQEHLAIINKKFTASNRFMRNKDYAKSIEALKNAYYITSELSESSCSRCAEFFRSTITKSLENMQEDLHKMSTGLFRPKRYQLSYKLASSVLEEFKKDN